MFAFHKNTKKLFALNIIPLVINHHLSKISVLQKKKNKQTRLKKLECMPIKG